MRLYLAHQLKTRHEVRVWELEFEKKTGVELINPFYDCPNRKDINILDDLNKDEQREYLLTRPEGDSDIIVERDLELIRKSDGVVAFVTGSIGTSMEIIMAHRIYGLPVYIISEKFHNHAWIVNNSIKRFQTKEAFEEWFNAVYK